ncbi:hypothetical protein KIW84_071821 [Lathyrus oleraceus]|uniref:Uncharacterized protein n=1 Tax=Pisum sativum TaxID=3888 RepID=A0A9D4VLQ5_PEA|nr:hypothetical protein KIW84_071821 [Pisum sativum]
MATLECSSLEDCIGKEIGSEEDKVVVYRGKMHDGYFQKYLKDKGSSSDGLGVIDKATALRIFGDGEKSKEVVGPHKVNAYVKLQSDQVKASSDCFDFMVKTQKSCPLVGHRKMAKKEGVVQMFHLSDQQIRFRGQPRKQEVLGGNGFQGVEKSLGDHLFSRIRGCFTCYNRAGSSMSILDKFFLSENVIADWKIVGHYVDATFIDDLVLKREFATSEVWNQLILKDLLRQKLRASWLKEGNMNSSFFHRVMRARYRRNFISSVNSSDGMKEKVDEFKSEVRNFFKASFQEENMSRLVLSGVDMFCLSSEDNKYLEVAFSEEEVKVVVWICNDTKGPRYDSYSSSFMQNCWETIKRDMVRFVMDFYSKSTLSKATTVSIITLIPKINNL